MSWGPRCALHISNSSDRQWFYFGIEKLLSLQLEMVPMACSMCGAQAIWRVQWLQMQTSHGLLFLRTGDHP